VRRPVLLAGCACLAVSAAAVADSGGPPPPYSVNAFIGYRFGGNFNLADTGEAVQLRDHGSFAVALDARADFDKNYELLYSRQATVLTGGSFATTGTTVEYLHLGGTVTFENATPDFLPYFGGGLGVTRFTPDSPVGTSDTRFSMSLALGLRVPVSRHFQVRMEGRGYVSFVDTNTDFFCRSDQNGAICQIRSHGSTIFQFELLAGGTLLF
jgi:opacity protein-like surface antigen